MQNEDLQNLQLAGAKGRERQRGREGGRKEKEKKNRGGGNPGSKQHQDQLSPMVPWGQVNCLCPGSGDRVVTGNGEGGSAVLP